MNYNGPSMYPTLKPGDRLNIVPCLDAEIRVGDVVVFNGIDKPEKVVHRVVQKGGAGFRTWGDNNCDIDPDMLNALDIEGRVISIKRQDRIIKIQGGLKGRITGLLLRTKTRIDSALSRSLHSFYYMLSRSGILKKFIAIRVISFNRDHGVETQLIRKGKVIGRCLPGDKEWKIKRPYRLFVDVENLSKNNHE